MKVKADESIVTASGGEKNGENLVLGRLNYVS